MSPGGAPPRYKVAVVVWLAIYPTVLVTLALLRPFTADLTLPVQVLFLTLIVVPLAVWVLIPFLNRVLAGWLTSTPDQVEGLGRRRGRLRRPTR